MHVGSAPAYILSGHCPRCEYYLVGLSMWSLGKVVVICAGSAAAPCMQRPGVAGRAGSVAPATQLCTGCCWCINMCGRDLRSCGEVAVWFAVWTVSGGQHRPFLQGRNKACVQSMQSTRKLSVHRHAWHPCLLCLFSEGTARAVDSGPCLATRCITGSV